MKIIWIVLIVLGIVMVGSVSYFYVSAGMIGDLPSGESRTGAVPLFSAYVGGSDYYFGMGLPFPVELLDSHIFNNPAFPWKITNPEIQNDLRYAVSRLNTISPSSNDGLNCNQLGGEIGNNDIVLVFRVAVEPITDAQAQGIPKFYDGDGGLSPFASKTMSNFKDSFGLFYLRDYDGGIFNTEDDLNEWLSTLNRPQLSGVNYVESGCIDGVIKFTSRDSENPFFYYVRCEPRGTLEIIFEGILSILGFR